MLDPTTQPKREVFANPTIVTTFSDNVLVTKRPDGTVLLRCMTDLQEGAYEQARLVVTIDHARRIVDVIAKLTDYYPRKPEPETGQPAKADSAKGNKKA